MLRHENMRYMFESLLADGTDRLVIASALCPFKAQVWAMTTPPLKNA